MTKHAETTEPKNPVDDGQASDSDSSSDSDSDGESGGVTADKSGRGGIPALPDIGETSDRGLTLVDDEDSGLILHQPPTLDDLPEGKYQYIAL